MADSGQTKRLILTDQHIMGHLHAELRAAVSMMGGGFMLRTQRELTDVEMIDTLNEVIDIVVDCYQHPVREHFQKSARSAQIGYDIQRCLISHDLIRPGGIENG